MLSVVILSVVMLSVVMLSVLASTKGHQGQAYKKVWIKSTYT